MYSCPGCGSSMTFDIQGQQLKCGRCDRTESIAEADRREARQAGHSFSVDLLTCPTCGAALRAMNTASAAFCSYCGSSVMRGKPAAAIVSARRAGTTAAIDQLNKYFTISGMPIVPSQYWPMVHGNKPEQVMKDEEGLQIMRHLARNLAWMVKSFALARENGILPPELEAERKRTNFIR